MKQYLQPLAWGMAMASIVAVASGFALSMVASTAQAATAHDHGPRGQAMISEPRQVRAGAPTRPCARA